MELQNATLDDILILSLQHRKMFKVKAELAGLPSDEDN